MIQLTLFPVLLSSILFLSHIPLDDGFNSFRLKPMTTRRYDSILSSDTVLSSDSLIDLKSAVQQYLLSNSCGTSPFIEETSGNLRTLNSGSTQNSKGIISISDNVKFTTDLIKGEGLQEYQAMSLSWYEASRTLLSEGMSYVTRISSIPTQQQQNITVINIQWNVTFIPDSLISLVWLTRLIPGTKLKFFNVLDKEKIRSSFSWASFRVFLERILYTGVVLLPHAVILGTTELSFCESESESESESELDLGSESELESGLGLGSGSGSRSRLESKLKSKSVSMLELELGSGLESKKEEEETMDNIQNFSQIQNGNENQDGQQNEKQIENTLTSTPTQTELLSFSPSKIYENINSNKINPSLQNSMLKKQKKWILQTSKEKINLVRSVDSGVLKNRKLATDLLQFLDARKPNTVSLDDWNDLLISRINTKSIPGMGQFDIDGLEGI